MNSNSAAANSAVPPFGGGGGVLFSAWLMIPAESRLLEEDLGVQHQWGRGCSFLSCQVFMLRSSSVSPSPVPPVPSEHAVPLPGDRKHRVWGEDPIVVLPFLESFPDVLTSLSELSLLSRGTGCRPSSPWTFRRTSPASGTPDRASGSAGDGWTGR